MSIALILKLLGGFILAIAHKTLIRAARDEGTGWWIATFIIPGAAIAFGLRYFRHFTGALVAIAVGGVLTASGFALGIYERVQEAKASMLAGEDFPGGDRDDEDDDFEGDDGTGERPRYAAASLPQSSAVIPQIANVSFTADQRTRAEKLQKRYGELITARAALNTRNEDAVRRFNLRAAEYHEALAQLRAELGHASASRR